jgi:ABC-type nitrate/sulfonate/bicarbonate transport system substrate-binding protein
MSIRFRPMILFTLFVSWTLSGRAVEAKDYIAYISDSTNSSSITWVAKEAGIFKKHGLDLDTIFINGSVRGIQSLIAGDLNFTGAVGTSAINGRLAGGDIRIISSLVNTLPYYVVGKPEIKSPEDLKGRSAATHIPGTSADFALRLALRRFGMDYLDIRAVTIGGSPARVAAVMSGQLDFTVVTEPGKIEAERAGLKVIMNMAKLDIPFQFTCAVTTGQMIREQPEKVMGFVKAMAEAVHFYKNNKEQVIKIMQKYRRGQERPVLEGAYAAYDDLLVKDTYPTLEGLKNTLDVQSAFDPKAVNAKVEDLVELRFVNELKKSGFIYKLYSDPAQTSAVR